MIIFNPPNSIWPNGLKKDNEGYTVFYPLGTNKVEIPMNSPQWPKGDKLVSPFVYQDDKLVGFCDTKAMVGVDGSTIIMPYEHIEVDFSSIEKDAIQIHAPKATTKTVIWKNSNKEDIADVNYKYKGCTTVNEITAVDENYMTTDVVDGTWNEILSDLENSRGMFSGCIALTTFNSDVSSLTNGHSMFYNCTNLTSFNSDLSSLTTGTAMFKNCTALTSFNSDLSSLTDGERMFLNCPLFWFTSDLRSLTNGFNMFKGSYLDPESVKNIADTINTVTDKPVIHIGVDIMVEDGILEQYFTQIHEKGWEVYVNSSSESFVPGTSTLDEIGETQAAPKPYWAKPVPATEETAQYIDENGNFFNILGGQFIYVSDPDTYGMFTCEEDAAANMRLTPYIKPQTEIENQ